MKATSILISITTILACPLAMATSESFETDSLEERSSPSIQRENHPESSEAKLSSPPPSCKEILEWCEQNSSLDTLENIQLKGYIFASEKKYEDYKTQEINRISLHPILQKDCVKDSNFNDNVLERHVGTAVQVYYLYVDQILKSMLTLSRRDEISPLTPENVSVSSRKRREKRRISVSAPAPAAPPQIADPHIIDWSMFY